ncbi:hypothetical protein F442_01760 [Phytophthora nicotianae P10297]|uniref:Uncharacterized protein n=1 Tax=Phytophthora nicotianae P10297 TaxID=1317064 RepID=W3A122_PHYNI|nr:hypothetical protein F442_01760 [Phytophthora nicotianae P10297]
MPTSDVEMLFDSFKTFKVTKSHLVSCGLCGHAAPHAMRIRLLACSCPTCEAVVPSAPCAWRGKTLACQHLNLMRVEEIGVHVSPAPSTIHPRLTAPMKEVAREWAAQGLKPSRIRSGFLRRFNLDEQSLPALSVVQKFVHNYATNHLRNNDLIGTVRAKIQEAAFTGTESESDPFTFVWENDASGRPIVGNGSDDTPFVVGVTTKRLLQRLDRDPMPFVFHVDATY